MASTAATATDVALRTGQESMVEGGHSWLLPVAAVGRGVFELALRAASVAWRPESTITRPTPPLIVMDPEVALPVVLEAWRATERELARMTGDSPEQEYLEANAAMLQAMYQRLYSERMRR